MDKCGFMEKVLVYNDDIQSRANTALRSEHETKKIYVAGNAGRSSTDHDCMQQ